jgi:acetyl esterase/lipase
MLRIAQRLEPLNARRRTPARVRVEPVGAVTARVHRPASAHGGRVAAPALLWIHGGGYVIGEPAQDDLLARTVADELGAVVAAVGYRKAPEYPFPIPLHDCHDALVWLARQPGVDPDRIAIGGASAGGGLAAALALLARERGEVQPVFQLLSYPMLDDRTALRTDIDERRLRLWSNEANRYGWECYLGCAPGGADVSGFAAPARHDDLTGLPPAWIGVGTCDLFQDEDLAYARRLDDAGVPCEVHEVVGAFHGFDMVSPKAPVTQAYRAAQVAALGAALGTGPRP